MRDRDRAHFRLGGAGCSGVLGGTWIFFSVVLQFFELINFDKNFIEKFY